MADIGSTGARFELIERRADGFRRVLRDKVRLELGQKVFSGGGIEEAAELRLSQLLERWREICEQTGARARFVATSAFREAHNSQAVVDGIPGPELSTRGCSWTGAVRQILSVGRGSDVNFGGKCLSPQPIWKSIGSPSPVTAIG